MSLVNIIDMPSLNTCSARFVDNKPCELLSENSENGLKE